MLQLEINITNHIIRLVGDEKNMSKEEMIKYLLSTGLMQDDKETAVEKMKDTGKTIPISELVERFVEVDKEFHGEPWNIKQILANINMIIPVEDRNCGVLGGQSTFGFGDAIRYLKRGLKVARKGWNGKKQYIQLATGISYKTADGEIVNCEHNAIGNMAIAFVGTSGVQMGWLASQADMLADDWVFAKQED